MRRQGKIMLQKETVCINVIVENILVEKTFTRKKCENFRNV